MNSSSKENKTVHIVADETEAVVPATMEKTVKVSTIEELCHDDNAEEYNYVFSLFFKNGDTVDGNTIENLVTRDENCDLQYVFMYAGKILLCVEENVLLDFIPAVACYSGNVKGILATMTENMTRNSGLSLAAFLRGLNTYIRTKYDCERDAVDIAIAHLQQTNGPAIFREAFNNVDTLRKAGTIDDLVLRNEVVAQEFVITVSKKIADALETYPFLAAHLENNIPHVDKLKRGFNESPGRK